jgi:polysaccharide export outer membrane protein
MKSKKIRLDQSTECLAQGGTPLTGIREHYMKSLFISLFVIALSGPISAQQQQANPSPAGTAPNTISDGPNLSVATLGRDDLISVTVYDAPELTRTVRVDAEGNIRLPMVRQHIQAAGQLPAELETAIATALTSENVLVNPVVAVTVVEYHSRPITIVGAVRNPTTIQAAGTVTLLDAITRAGGISGNAGSEILVSHRRPSADGTAITLTDRIPVHSLMDAADPASNMKLEGGEVIRVPEAGQIFVVGNVKRPGAFQLTNDSESSVMKVMALTGGLDSFSSHTAYIYRIDGTSGRKNEIPVAIKKILARKSPDVPLYGNDMLYVPNATGQRVTAKTLELTVGLGLALTGLLIYVIR